MFGYDLHSSTSAINSSQHLPTGAPTGFGYGVAGPDSWDFPELHSSGRGFIDSSSTPWSRWSEAMSAQQQSSEKGRAEDNGNGAQSMSNWVTLLTADTGRPSGDLGQYGGAGGMASSSASGSWSWTVSQSDSRGSWTTGDSKYANEQRQQPAFDIGTATSSFDSFEVDFTTPGDGQAEQTEKPVTSLNVSGTGARSDPYIARASVGGGGEQQQWTRAAAASDEVAKSSKTMPVVTTSNEVEYGTSTIVVKGFQDVSDVSGSQVYDGVVDRSFLSLTTLDLRTRLSTFVPFPDWQVAAAGGFAFSAEPSYAEAVARLVQKTWKGKLVGKGRDAVGLDNYNSITVLRVCRVNNDFLRCQYEERLEELSCTKHRAWWLKKPHHVETRSQPGCEILDALLNRQANEYLLFHGMHKDHVGRIAANGFEVMNYHGQMYGNGVYFSESSTKSDQYTDEPNARTYGVPLFMTLARVALGKVYSKDGRGEVDSADSLCQRGYNSIVGTHRPDGVKLRFREFMIFDGEQAYPEFIIEYRRNIR